MNIKIAKPLIQLNLNHLKLLRVEKHLWGYEYWLANCEPGCYGAKILEFHWDWHGSEHSHDTKDEILIATNVSITVYTRETEGAPLVSNQLLLGEQMRIVPGRRHMIENRSGETVYILEISNFEDEKTVKYLQAGKVLGVYQ